MSSQTLNPKQVRQMMWATWLAGHSMPDVPVSLEPEMAGHSTPDVPVSSEREMVIVTEGALPT